jgi:hypothetical protein
VEGKRSAKEDEELDRELRLLQIEMNKHLLILDRVRCEIRQLDEEQAAACSTSSPSRLLSDLSQQVTSLRRQVSTAQQAQSCQVEYEALAALLHRRHATSFRALQSQAESIEKQIESASREVQHKQSTARVRSSQIQLLVQSIMDLKQSLLVNDAANGTDDAEPTPALPAGGPEGPWESSATRSAADEGRKATSGDVTPGDRNDNGDDDEEVEEGEEIDRDSNKAARDEDPAPRDDDLYGDLEDSSR